ncbi:hypothetical protein DPMN_183203 [Dreissena polymorpha]|uniref:Uncharacterized protein n=1 Tax=Dreissena polymorpha TaxID=45954 RepID=A0A9D4DH38_DREPO|nr:hypothetical protein DPMN_183203 [Dreissena polymorpha]
MTTQQKKPRTRHNSSPAGFDQSYRHTRSGHLLPSCNSIDVFVDLEYNDVSDSFDDLGMEGNLSSNKPKKSSASLWMMPFTMNNIFN